MRCLNSRSESSLLLLRIGCARACSGRFPLALHCIVWLSAFTRVPIPHPRYPEPAILHASLLRHSSGPSYLISLDPVESAHSLTLLCTLQSGPSETPHSEVLRTATRPKRPAQEVQNDLSLPNALLLHHRLSLPPSLLSPGLDVPFYPRRSRLGNGACAPPRLHVRGHRRDAVLCDQRSAWTCVIDDAKMEDMDG